MSSNMKKEIRQDSINYVATVVEIKEVHAIEGADKIGVVYINGNPVITQKDLDVTKPVVYFTAGTQLSDGLCKVTNSYSSPEMNCDTTKKGFIDKTRRVKIIKLRSTYSNGMILPLDFFPKGLEVGDEFTSIDGVQYCQKYFVPIKTEATVGDNHKKKIKKMSRIIENQFQFHGNTSHLAKSIHLIKPDTVIEVSHKLHGTSQITSNTLTKRQLTFAEKLAKYFGCKIQDRENYVVYSSRNVIKNGSMDSGFYKEDVWKVVKEEIQDKLPKGVTVYGEIVGYTPSGQAIQKGYDYGCRSGEHKFLTYRMTSTNEDGFVLEWSPIQIKEFCDSRGMLFTDYLIYYGEARHFVPNLKESEDFGEQFLQHCIDKFTEKDCQFCVNKVPEEGIVVRIDSGEEYKAFKLKSQRFILGESKAQDNGETNMEDDGE